MIDFEKASDINTKFKPGDLVCLKEDPQVMYNIDQILIDNEAVKYILKPKPKGGSDFYWSNQLDKKS